MRKVPRQKNGRSTLETARTPSTLCAPLNPRAMGRADFRLVTAGYSTIGLADYWAAWIGEGEFAGCGAPAKKPSDGSCVGALLLGGVTESPWGVLWFGVLVSLFGGYLGCFGGQGDIYSRAPAPSGACFWHALRLTCRAS